MNRERLQERLQEFLRLLHAHGADSQEVIEYLEGIEDNELFDLCVISRRLMKMLQR